MVCALSFWMRTGWRCRKGEGRIGLVCGISQLRIKGFGVVFASPWRLAGELSLSESLDVLHVEPQLVGACELEVVSASPLTLSVLCRLNTRFDGIAVSFWQMALLTIKAPCGGRVALLRHVSRTGHMVEVIVGGTMAQYRCATSAHACMCVPVR